MSGEEKKQRVHLRPLLAHGARHWKAYLLGVISLAAVDFINSLLLPCLIGIPFEQADKEHAGRALFAPFFRDLLGVGTNSTARVFLECGLLYVAINIVQMGLRYFWRYFFMGGAERIGFEVRAALFRKLQRLPVSWFDRAKTGDLMSRATSDIDYVKSAYGFGALMAFDSLCYLAMVPFSLFWISPKLAGLLCCALPLVTVLIYKLGGIVHRRSRVVQDVSGKLSARLQESFSGIRVVQSFAQEEREAERFEAVAREYVESQLSLARIQAVWGPSFEAIFEVAGAIILIVGGLDVVKGLLEPADFVRFIRGMDNLIWPMAAVGMLANSLQRGAAAHARLEEIHSETEDPAFLSERVPAEAEVRGAVSVRSLTFSFPGATGKPLALEDVSFEAPAGALVAVVGPVGSGKSALLWLLARLYEPPAGKIFLDGRDILSIPIATLRRAVAIVPQETFLFSATIEDNVKLGRAGDLTREHVEAATRAAQVADEVEGVPGGYAAILGERGVNLSGGQRQRVAIARAIVRSPRVLLLDDSLSAVDTETETRINEEIRASSGDGSPPTRFVATHRLAAARNADLVLVLERGRLVEQGTHAELMARGGLYSRLARRDALAEELTHV